MNASSFWWGWGWACHKSCPRERGSGGKLYYDKHWEVEWAIVLSQYGGAHIPLPCEMWLCDWAWAGDEPRAVIQAATAEEGFEATCMRDTKANDKLLSKLRILFFFHCSARLGRQVIEREHANKANDFPPTLHFFPWGSCLRSWAHTSFTKYSSVSPDPPRTFWGRES